MPSVAAEKVAAGGFWVLRPDSGDPTDAVIAALEAADKAFGEEEEAEEAQRQRKPPPGSQTWEGERGAGDAGEPSASSGLRLPQGQCKGLYGTLWDCNLAAVRVVCRFGRE